MAGAFVIPKFVFFYEVVGNETVPEAQILRELQNLGVGFGTYGPSIRPQELKNRMLLQIPKLQWLTVQQSGMRWCSGSSRRMTNSKKRACPMRTGPSRHKRHFIRRGTEHEA